MFIDSATITVRSGRGGAGAVSFRREKYIPKGGPDGGDGGTGGSVILRSDKQVATLLDFSGKHHWFAKNGEAGQSKQRHGKDGNALLVTVPVGTLVYDDDTGELITDLDTHAAEYVIAKGGLGGFGNEHFKSATNQTPRQFTPGEAGEEKLLRLELKLIADVGLVGLPNAGKSTFLSSVSKARPKIADYPFTTLEPHLGIAQINKLGKRLVIADLPGLIENAHEGQGLGDRFLRHIERTKLIVHVIDANPVDGSNEIENYKTIRRELEGYGDILANKKEIIAISKIDMLEESKRQKKIKDISTALGGAKVLPISSVANLGLDELLVTCYKALDKEDIEGWG